jgi:serine/threonine-protein kinase RsbT
MRVSDDLRVPIVNEVDVVEARRSGRALAAELGFGLSDQALIATAISELARNILQYARRGELVIGVAQNGGRKGIDVVAVDQGPGIADPEKAMRDGYSTGSGLGLGLPGTRRIMDEFELDTEIGRGTRVAVKKWVP